MRQELFSFSFFDVFMAPFLNKDYHFALNYFGTFCISVLYSMPLVCSYPYCQYHDTLIMV